MAGGYPNHHAGCYKDFRLSLGRTGRTCNNLEEHFQMLRSFYVPKACLWTLPSGACDFGWHYISHKLLLLSGYRLWSSVKNSFSKGICHSVVSSWIWGGVVKNRLLVLSIRNCRGEGNLRQPRGFWEFLLSLFGPLKSPPLHVPPGGGWNLSDKLAWVRWLGRL